ncbi:MAG TPA: phage tail tape measure protein [Solirubrobacteraceae bacterium]|jgi:TP901 family phage tail tape measure protein
MTVVGSAEILVRPVSTGFESEVKAQTAGAFSGVGKDAEKAGSEAGSKLDSGFKKGSSGLAKTIENLGLPLGGLGGHLTKTASGIGEVDSKSKGLTGTLSHLGGGTLALATAGIVGFGVAGIKAAVNYQSATTTIASQAGISVAAAKRISDAFLNTAGHTIYSAQEIAKAYGGVAGVLGSLNGKALDAAQAQKVMASAMNLAEGAGISLEAATNSLAKVMQAYHLGVGESSKASDILFSASRQTGVSVEALTQGLTRTKSKLGDLAPSLAESAGLLDSLAKNGVTGRTAISSLSGSFNTLVGGGKPATEMAKELGVQIFNSSGKFVGLKSIIEQLHPKLAGLTEQSQLQATKALFGASANRQMLSVIQQGPAAFAANTASVQRSGAAHEAAEKQAQTFSHQIDLLKATAIDLATKFGNILIPKLVALEKVLAEGIGWLEKHKEAAKALAIVIATVLGVAVSVFVEQKAVAFSKSIGTMLGDVGKLAEGIKSAVTKIVGYFTTESTAAATTAGEIETSNAAVVASADTTAVGVDTALGSTGVGLIVVGLGLAAVALATHWEAAMEAIQSITESVGAVVVGIINGLSEAIETLTLGLVSLGKIEAEHGGEGKAPGGRREEAENLSEGAGEGERGKGLGVEQQIMAFWKSKGFSAAAAAGFVGNAALESSLNVHEKGGGLYQQSGAANPEGVAAQGITGQSEEVLRRLPPSLISKLKHIADPRAAAGLIEKYFEQPAGSKPGEPGYGTAEQGGAHLRQREEAAAKALHGAHTKATELDTAALEKDVNAVGTHTLRTEAERKAASKAKAKAKTEPSVASITKWAEAHVGKFPESTGSNTGPELDRLQKEFGTRAAAWCAEFATTAAMMGGANKAVRTASVATIRQWAEQGSHGYKKGVTHTPASGELAMFGNEHVGFVQSVNKQAGTYTDIEGNTSGGKGVQRVTRRIGEGDFARPAYHKIEAGGEELKRASKGYEEAAKQAAASQKIVATSIGHDTKQANAALTKMVAAIHSGNLKQLQGVVGGIHDKWLHGMEVLLDKDHRTALSGMAGTVEKEHASALTGLVSKLVAAHKGALEAIKVALVKAAEKATVEREGREDTLNTDQADQTATRIANQTKVTLDHAAEAGKTGADLIAAQALTHFDEIKTGGDFAVGSAKQGVDNAAGHGEVAEANAKQALARAENAAKVHEAEAQSALDVANNAATEANAAQTKATQEQTEATEAQTKATEEATKAAEASKATAAPPPVHLEINGTNLSAGDLMTEVSWAINTGTLPVATAHKIAA